MKKIIVYAVLIFGCFSFQFPVCPADLNLSDTPVQVYFSPNGGCTQAIVKEINKSVNEILVQAYSFTSAPVAKALVDANKRGVRIQVVLDKSQRSERYSSVTFFANSGIPVYIDAIHAIAHNKIMIIDKGTVITGSFNFTKAAEEKNAENLIIIKSKELSAIYIDNWQKHRQHSEKYSVNAEYP